MVDDNNVIAVLQPFLRDVRAVDRLQIGRRLLILVAMGRLARTLEHPSWTTLRNAAAHYRDFRDVRMTLLSLGAAIEETRPEFGTIFTDVLVDEALRAGGALPEHVLRASAALEALEALALDDRSFARWFDFAIDEVAETGPSAGAYATPRALARLLVALVGIKPGDRVLDPCCGTGALLSAAYEACPSAALFGQDVDPLAVSLTTLRLNLLTSASVRLGDTLRAPAFIENQGLASFDRIVCDPPVGAVIDWETLPPPLAAGPAADARQSETLFAALTLAALGPDGRAAVAVPKSFLTRKGPEAELRAEWLRHDSIEGVVALPPGVHPWTKVLLSVLVFANSKSFERRGQLILVDGSRADASSGRSTLRLRDDDLASILKAYEAPAFDLRSTSIPVAAAIEATSLDPLRLLPGEAKTFDLDETLARITELDRELRRTAAQMDSLFDEIRI